MKILQINCTDKGSVGKIMDCISEELRKNGHQSIVCHSLGNANGTVENHYKTSGKIEPGLMRRVSYYTGIPYGLAPISTYHLLKRIDNEKPDIVHLHCPNANMNVYRILNWLKKNHYPVVLTNHCEMFYTGNCAYSFSCEGWKTGCKTCRYLHEYCGPYKKNNTAKAWRLMYEAIDGFESLTITSVSEWVRARSSQSPITRRYRNIVIGNGVDTTIYHYSSEGIKDLKRKYKIPDGKMILFVTARFSTDPKDIKGGYFFSKLAESFIDSDFSFVIIGPSKNIPILPKNTVYLGEINEQKELVNLYSMSDLCVVCSKKETFSMPCAESFCCGTPVVGFRAGGPESISIAEYSEFCEYGDIQALHDIVKKWVYDRCISHEELSSIATKKYNKEKMGKEYISLYEDILIHRGLS